MARKPLIAGNWKMNKTAAEAKAFLEELKNRDIPEDRDVLVCPAFTSLNEAARLLKGSKIFFGAQNMHFKESGAFTGEISPLMLKEIGCDYVILGHSERRHVFGEEDVLINNKVKGALKHGLNPILCVGETIEQRKDNKTSEIIKEQVLEGLRDVSEISKVTIAYEPVWAIGTGETATPRQAEAIHIFIRALVSHRYSDAVGKGMRILYGGSVKPSNIKNIMAEEDIDGVLVGGTSLDIEQFSRLVNFDN
ncbi:triose-phosphate isomerase [Candidatus Woesearchaeota archaeon]|nr:triose-phosphate isomerase [Candidatus Woesearchaeota archaeon]